MGQPFGRNHPAPRHQQQRQQRPPSGPAQTQLPSIPDHLYRPQNAELNHQTLPPERSSRLHRQPGLTDSICQPRPAAESELDRRTAAGRHRWLAHAVPVPGLSLPSDQQGEDEDHRAAKGHECLCPAVE